MGSSAEVNALAKRSQKRTSRCIVRSSGIVIVAALAATRSATAIEWKVTPAIELTETYSDNISLAPSGFEQSDLHSKIVPSVNVSGTGPNFRLNVDYGVVVSRYLEENLSNSVNQILELRSKAKLLEGLYLESSAGINQANVSLFSQIGDRSRQNLNSSTVRTFTLSPYYQYRFGEIATGEARYTGSVVNSDQKSPLANSQSDRLSASLVSGRAYRDWTWALQFSDEKIQYRELPDSKSRTYSASGQYRVTPKIKFLGTLGYESNSYVSFGENPSGAIINGGIAWRPSSGTEFQGSVGRRFFGTTYSLDFSHQRKNSIWRLTYGQSLTSSRTQFATQFSNLSDFRNFLDGSLASRGDNDPVSRGAEVDRIVEDLKDRGLITDTTDSSALVGPLPFFSNRAFLEKRLEGSLLLELRRNSLLLKLFDTSREAQQESLFFGLDDFAISRRIDQSGLGILLGSELSARTRATVGFNYSRRNFVNAGRSDNSSVFNVGLSRTLKPRIEASIQLNHRVRDSSRGIGEYDENSLVGSVKAQF